MHHLRARFTYANVMATIAVFIALGGASYAAVKLPKNSVGTKQIKKGAVTGAKIKDGTITGAKINVSTLGAVPSAVHAGAADAGTLDGQSAAQIAAAGKLTCPAGTSLFGGVCFETTSRGSRSLTDAMEVCGEAGRFLPTVNELFSYEAATYISGPPQEWAGQIYYDGTELVGVLLSAYSNGSGVSGAASSFTSHPYRCVVMPTN
jgi:hypothetical protein